MEDAIAAIVVARVHPINTVKTLRPFVGSPLALADL